MNSITASRRWAGAGQTLMEINHVARIAYADLEKADHYVKDVLAAQKKTWGAPLLNHLLYARRPSIFRSARAMWTGIEASGLIHERLRALVNRRVAALNGCEF